MYMLLVLQFMRCPSLITLSVSIALTTLDSKVLSGKEPYSHHLGPFSIISGVVMTGERPPKDPSAGSDGSSYLEFWEEAEKCWDGDPTRRPSMRSVLRRLDRQRYEMLVTSQQLSLETSLDTDDQAQTQ